MKVHKVELLILNFDDVSEQEIKMILEETRYPNRCISPDVKSIKTVEVEWSDDHPLNQKDTCNAEYKRLFDEGKP